MLFLRVFTDAGLLMHFDAPGLRDLVVLQPQWLLNAMRDVLCSRTIDACRKVARGATKKALRALRDCGRLEVDAVLPALWPQLPAAEHAVLFAYLARFDLCVPLKSGAGVEGGGAPLRLAAVPALFSANGPTHWAPRPDDLAVWFVCAHRAAGPARDAAATKASFAARVKSFASAALARITTAGDAASFAARDAFDDECRYLPRTLFHSLVARVLGAGTAAGTRAAFARLGAERAVLQSADGQWLKLELDAARCEIRLTLRAEAGGACAAALLSQLSCDYWPQLETKYGVQMRVELERRGEALEGEPGAEGASPSAGAAGAVDARADSARVDLATGCVVGNREPAPALCARWRVASKLGTTVAAASALVKAAAKVGAKAAAAVSAVAPEAAAGAVGVEGTEGAAALASSATAPSSATTALVSPSAAAAERAAPPRHSARDEAAFDERQRGGPWDFFLSHRQRDAGDAVASLHLLLERWSCTSWYDNQMADLTASGMAHGVRNSDVFLLFLTKGIFQRPYVLFELLEAIDAEKRIVLLHEESGAVGGGDCAFDFDGTTGVPPEVQIVTSALLRHFQSLPWRRLRHEQRSLLAELLRRRAASELKTFYAACGADVDAEAVAGAVARVRRDIAASAEEGSEGGEGASTAKRGGKGSKRCGACCALC